MRKKRIAGIFAAFLAFMMMFTWISRAADTMNVAQVRTAAPQRGKISHVVTGSGKVVQRRELAVSTEPGQIVETLYAEEGQQVEAGELLFSLAMEPLQEQILALRQEMKIDELNAQDHESGLEVQAFKRSVSQGRAQEDYQAAANDGNRAVSRAAANLQAAKKKLEAFQKSDGQTAAGEDKVAQTLQQTLADKTQAYEEAVRDEEALQAEIDRLVAQAVTEAQQAAEAEAVRQAAEAARQAAEAEQQAAEAEAARQAAEAEAARQAAEAARQAAEAEVAEAEPADTYDMGEIPELADDFYEEELILGDTGGGSALAQAELELLEQQIRQQNQPFLEAAQARTSQAEAEAAQARQALEDYAQERASWNGADRRKLLEQYREEVKTAQQAYEDAASAANDLLRSAGRTVQDAEMPEQEDSTNEIGEITRQQKELQLQKLERLLEAGGKVTAPTAGMVTKINVMTGERTPDGTAVLMADAKAGNQLVVQVSSGQEAYIGRGDSVVIKTENGRQTIEGRQIELVRANESDSDLLDVTVRLEAEALEIGTLATVECTKTSAVYECCVPVTALRQEQNQYYVLMLAEKESVLGTELTAQRVNVTVLEKNETTAALAPGSIRMGDKVITESDKYVDEGSRVRLEET